MIHLFVIVFMAVAQASAIDAQSIIQKVDRIRNPGKPFFSKNRLTEYSDGAVKNEMLLNVYSKEDKETGQFKSVIQYKEPARDAGKIVLLNGTTMWFYDPASKASVRISPQQRLIGQASEGDVVTVNLDKDYRAKLVNLESLDDADRKKRQCYHLELTPSKPEAIYNRIEFWVEEGTFRPVKGKFYSDSGRLLKIAYYHHFEMQMGAERPTETIIIDALNPKLVTTMNFSQYKEKEIPESWFQRDFLPHLKAE